MTDEELTHPAKRGIVLIDADAAAGAKLVARLRAQGYAVAHKTVTADGIRLALAHPPLAIVADLWMPGISGIQTCRLLKAEASTNTVPIVLRGPDEQENRFWAEQAGADAYVAKGRVGDLVRAIQRAIFRTADDGDFFTELPEEGIDIRDRIAEHLDFALFESVIASEVRGLAQCGRFDRLFDLLSQFISRATSYRWLALLAHSPTRFALHAHPRRRAAAELEARASLHCPETKDVVYVGDEDALADDEGAATIVRELRLGGDSLGLLAMSPRQVSREKSRRVSRDAELLTIVARELASPLRMTTLIEESERLVTVDALTGVMNRRAFLNEMKNELARSKRLAYPVCVALFTLDGMHIVSQEHGYGARELVLAALGRLLLSIVRQIDIVARWEGDEFVITLTGCDLDAGERVLERFRKAIASMKVGGPTFPEPIAVTASFGLTSVGPGDDPTSMVARAGKGMIFARGAGGDRVVSLLARSTIAAPPLEASAVVEAAIAEKTPAT